MGQKEITEFRREWIISLFTIMRRLSSMRIEIQKIERNCSEIENRNRIVDDSIENYPVMCSVCI